MKSDIQTLGGDLFGIEQSSFEQVLWKNGQPARIQEISRIDCINPNYYGGRGEKAVVRVLYSQSGQALEASFFIKKHCRCNPNKALHYKFLTQFGAPIPRLYAYRSLENEQDIVITEVLRPLCIDDDPVFMMNREAFEPFVEATALFNAVDISDEYKAIIVNDYDLLNNKIRPFQQKMQSMFDSVEKDPTYLRIRKSIAKQMQGELTILLRDICDRIETMEKGLYHWDHKPRNFGWSDLQQRHVIFDLEDTLWGPRFYNIGMWLGGYDHEEGKYASREELARRFLDFYNEASGENVSVDCLLHEIRPLWIAHKIETLLACFYESGENPYRRRNQRPDEYMRKMQDSFLELAELLCGLKC